MRWLTNSIDDIALDFGKPQFDLLTGTNLISAFDGCFRNATAASDLLLLPWQMA
jgi:hypothetical protein